MSNLPPSQIILDTDLDIIVIHGVGNPVAGDLGRTVGSTLQRVPLSGHATVRVFEYNWNQIVEPSARGGVILPSAWQDLSLTLAYASAVGDGTQTRNWPARLLRIIGSGALMFAELCLFAGLSVLLIILPLLFVTLGFARNDALLYESTNVTLTFVRSCVIGMVSALIILIFSG